MLHHDYMEAEKEIDEIKRIINELSKEQEPQPGPALDVHPFIDQSNKRSRWHRRLEILVRKVTTPLNSLATGRGCESFVGLSMWEECAKAARILRSFSSHPTSPVKEGETSTSHIVTIPPSAISSAVGVIVFTTGRVGLSRLSGSTGSGILITRREDNGTFATTSPVSSHSESAWNYPVAIQAHGVGLGPLALGFDVSDRVYLIRSREGLDKLLNKEQFMVGPEVVLAVGRWGGGAGMTFLGSFKDVKDGVNKGREEAVNRMRGREWGERRGTAGCQNCGSHVSHQTQANGDGEGGRQPAQSGSGNFNETEKSWEAIGEADEKSGLLADGSVDVQVPRSSPPSSPSQDQTPSPPPGRGRTSHPPIYCYMRSHGLYAGLQAEGTVFSKRDDDNIDFYFRGGDVQSTQVFVAGERAAKAVEGVWEALREMEFGSRE